MASYENQKDAFDSDSGLWNVSVTNGESGVTGGARYLRRTSGAAWDETSMIAANGRQPALLDGVEFVFTIDDLSTSGSDGSFIFIALRVNNGTTTSDVGGAAGFYIYPDGGGVRAHGYTSGVCTDLSPATNMVQGEVYTAGFFFGADGKLTIGIKGGVFGSSYVDLATPLVDAVTGAPYGTWRGMVNIAYIHSDVSIRNFEWYDSGGPDPVGGGGGVACGEACKSAMSQGWL